MVGFPITISLSEELVTFSDSNSISIVLPYVNGNPVSPLLLNNGLKFIIAYFLQSFHDDFLTYELKIFLYNHNENITLGK